MLKNTPKLSFKKDYPATKEEIEWLEQYNKELEAYDWDKFVADCWGYAYIGTTERFGRGPDVKE